MKELQLLNDHKRKIKIKEENEEVVTTKAEKYQEEVTSGSKCERQKRVPTKNSQHAKLPRQKVMLPWPNGSRAYHHFHLLEPLEVSVL